MPFRQRGFYGRQRGFPRPKVSSEKNVVTAFTAGAAGAKVRILIAQAVNAADNTVVAEVTRDCHIYKIWVELWISATAEVTVGTTNGIDAYIFKSPGSNLVSPVPGTVGSSNEKKFVFKTWKGLIGARTQGFPAYTWRGWVKVPKVYQRMETDDIIQFIFQATGVATIVCHNFIYKWFK